MHVEGRTLTELETNARAALDQVADGRAYTFELQQAHGSAGRDEFSPVARMSAGYRGARLSGFVTATFAEKAGADPS